MQKLVTGLSILGSNATHSYQRIVKVHEILACRCKKIFTESAAFPIGIPVEILIGIHEEFYGHLLLPTEEADIHDHTNSHRKSGLLLLFYSYFGDK